MSLSIGTSLAAHALVLGHEAPSLVLYNGHAGLGANLAGPPADAPVDGRSLESCKTIWQRCLPEVDDQVPVAFEHGQSRCPFVIAPLWDPEAETPRDNAATEVKHPDYRTSGVSHLDSLSEMGETESLRLQMAMDRLSEMMSTLSNVLQKIDETQAAITQNIK